MAKVDVLLPYWGDVELLKKAVESVLSQTEQDWRLFIIDDCYPSAEPVKYCKGVSDKRVTYIRHKQNLGITNNFNFALTLAEAEYCVMMGCDDIMLPHYLEAALANIGQADFYQPSVDVIDEDGKVYLPLGDRVKRLLQPKRAGIYSGEKLATSICIGNWLYFPAILWKTTKIKRYGFEARYKIVEDMVLELSILCDGGTMFFDDKTTFQYRRFAKSLSSVEKSKGGIRFNEELEVYKFFAIKFKRMGWPIASRAAQLRPTSRLNQLIS